MHAYASQAREPKPGAADGRTWPVGIDRVDVGRSGVDTVGEPRFVHAGVRFSSGLPR